MKKLILICVVGCGLFSLTNLHAENPSTHLTLRIVDIQSTELKLEVRWSEDFHYPWIRIYSKTNLCDSEWETPEQGVWIPGINSHEHIDKGISNMSYCFYKAEGYDSDRDGDMLSDRWEISFGLNPLSAKGDDGALGDKDDDGIPNGVEYVRNTNPTNSSKGNVSMYVDATVGNDSYDGLSLEIIEKEGVVTSGPKAHLHATIQDAYSGDTLKIAAGNYQEIQSIVNPEKNLTILATGDVTLML